METQGRNFFTSLPGAVLLIVAYGVAHSLMRLSGSWNLGENDPLSLLRSQNLTTLLASGPHPFDVLTFTLVQMIGENALVFQILRYALLGFALIFVFLISRRVMGSGWWALITVESYALIYQISWRFHEGFTYPLITMLAVAGTFWAVFRGGRTWTTALLVTLFIALGLVSGFWYWVFLCGLWLALFLAHGQYLFKSPIILRLVLSAGAAIAVFLLVERALRAGLPADENAFFGALEAGLNALAFLAPLLPILIVFFPREFFQIIAGEQAEIKAIRVMSVFVFLGLVAAGGVMGAAPYPEHALMPIFFLTPIWLMDRIRRAFPSTARVQRFTGLCLCLMLVAFAARAANFYILDPICNRCYFGIPFEQLSNELAERYELDGNARIISFDPRLGGHLVAFWPDKAKPMIVVEARNPDLFADKRPTLAVWSLYEGRPVTSLDKKVTKWLRALGANKAEAKRAVRDKQILTIGWPHLWRQTGYRQSRWGATLLYADE